MYGGAARNVEEYRGTALVGVALTCAFGRVDVYVFTSGGGEVQDFSLGTGEEYGVMPVLAEEVFCRA